MDTEIEVARVEDYFAQVGAAALEITNQFIRIGDALHFKGHTTDLLLEVSSLEIDNKPVKQAATGAHVGIKVPERVRVNDRVFKIVQEL